MFPLKIKTISFVNRKSLGKFILNNNTVWFVIGIIIYCYLICSCYRTVPSEIWEIFSELLIFCNLFQEPLGE